MHRNGRVRRHWARLREFRVQGSWKLNRCRGSQKDAFELLVLLPSPGLYYFFLFGLGSLGSACE